MKVIKYITLILVIAVTFMSCEDDQDLTKINESNFVASVLSGITADQNYVLVKDTTSVDSLKTIWVDLSWTEADFGQTLATTYTIQIDKVGSDFSNVIEFNTSSETEISILEEEINSKMYNMEDNYYPPLVEANVEIRVKAVVSEYVNPVYSTVTSFSLTPFDAGKPKLYVTGTHQPTPWDFASAQTIYSLVEDENYEGYIYLTDCEYKLNKTPDIAWGAGATAGTIEIGGTNLTNATEGMYWITVDTLAATISTEVRNWGIIGSAVPPYDWSVDVDMTYDFDLKKLKVTLDLTADEIKFRVNDDWAINLGDTDADGTMEPGGDNIVVPEAGNYTVYLDLSNPEKFSYELVKN
ncbi:MAG: SusE domain-containing protein [Bacteroidales bacterium]|nr:SusE domain-containing protein [Bacteroidales bacterium]